MDFRERSYSIVVVSLSAHEATALQEAQADITGSSQPLSRNARRDSQQGIVLFHSLTKNKNLNLNHREHIFLGISDIQSNHSTAQFCGL